METLEKGNKLITDFIGMQKTNIGWFDNEEVLDLPYTMDNTFDSLLFHKSSDWLMPVLKLIEEAFVESGLELFNGLYENQVYGIEDAIWNNNVEGMFIYTFQLIEILNKEK